MKNKHIIIYSVICAGLFIFGAAGSVIALNRPHGNIVKISAEGQVLYTLDLEKENDRIITVDTDRGRNVMEIKDGQIRVCEADCMDGICVKTGWLRSSAVPIVCLPHGLLVEFAENDGIDAISG